MPHVDHFVHAGHFDNVGLVVGKVGVGLDVGGHLRVVVTRLDFHVNHAAVNALTRGNSHGKRGLNALDGFHGHGVAHRHTRTEIRVAQSLGRNRLQKCAHYGIAARIPTGGNDAHGTGFACCLAEGAAQGGDLRVNVEAVHGVDTEGEDVERKLLYAAGRRGENGYVHVFQLANVAHHAVGFQLCRLFVLGITAHDAGNLEIGRGFKCFNRVAAYVAIAHYGGSYLFHVLGVCF